MTKIYQFFFTISAFVALCFYLLFKGKRSGKQQAESKQTKREQEAAREARKIEDDSRNLSSDATIKRMRERNKR